MAIMRTKFNVTKALDDKLRILNLPGLIQQYSRENIYSAYKICPKLDVLNAMGDMLVAHIVSKGKEARFFKALSSKWREDVRSVIAYEFGRVLYHQIQAEDSTRPIPMVWSEFPAVHRGRMLVGARELADVFNHSLQAQVVSVFGNHVIRIRVNREAFQKIKEDPTWAPLFQKWELADGVKYYDPYIEGIKALLMEHIPEIKFESPIFSLEGKELPGIGDSLINYEGDAWTGVCLLDNNMINKTSFALNLFFNTVLTDFKCFNFTSSTIWLCQDFAQNKYFNQTLSISGEYTNIMFEITFGFEYIFPRSYGDLESSEFGGEVPLPTGRGPLPNGGSPQVRKETPTVPKESEAESSAKPVKPKGSLSRKIGPESYPLMDIETDLEMANTNLGLVTTEANTATTRIGLLRNVIKKLNPNTPEFRNAVSLLSQLTSSINSFRQIISNERQVIVNVQQNIRQMTSGQTGRLMTTASQAVEF